MRKRKLRRILRESINSVLSESVAKKPWFIEEFINDFGVYFDSTDAENASMDKFKVQFMGGQLYGYRFTKIRVVYLQPRGTWMDDLAPSGAYQMVYSLPYRGILPSKRTKSPEKIQISKDLLNQYTAECKALGIEILSRYDRKYAKVPYALEDY